jgi:hypothetical protein
MDATKAFVLYAPQMLPATFEYSSAEQAETDINNHLAKGGRVVVSVVNTINYALPDPNDAQNVRVWKSVTTVEFLAGEVQ